MAGVKGEVFLKLMCCLTDQPEIKIMSLTSEQALTKLNDPANAAKYSTLDGLRDLAAETSGECHSGQRHLTF